MSVVVAMLAACVPFSDDYETVLGERMDATLDLAVPRDSEDAVALDEPSLDGMGDAGPVDVPAADASTPPGSITRLTGGPFRLPQDAVPSASGTVFYAIAWDMTDAPVVLRITGTGAPEITARGAPLDNPLGIAISGDDTRLFIVDSTADRTPAAAGDDRDDGAVFSLLASGGTPTPLPMTGAIIHHPRAIAVGGSPEYLIVVGTSDTGRPALFRVPSAGGMVTMITEALIDPGGVTVARDGTIYVVDALLGVDGTGSIRRFPAAGGDPASILTGLLTGYPAGIALTMDERHLLVSGRIPAMGPGLLLWVETTGASPTAPSIYETAMSGLQSPLGFHRARNTNVFSIADDRTTDMGGVLVAR